MIQLWYSDIASYQTLWMFCQTYRVNWFSLDINDATLQKAIHAPLLYVHYEGIVILYCQCHSQQQKLQTYAFYCNYSWLFWSLYIIGKGSNFFEDDNNIDINNPYRGNFRNGTKVRGLWKVRQVWVVIFINFCNSFFNNNEIYDEYWLSHWVKGTAGL